MWLLQEQQLYCSPAMSKEISFQSKGSSVIFRTLLNLFKGKQCFLLTREHFLPLKNAVLNAILIRCQNPLFEDFLYFYIPGEQWKCSF